jgi:hypothetical protein
MMICCNCDNYFAFFEIPVEERIYRKWYSVVSCPYCAQLLKPKKEKIIALNALMVIFLFMSAFLVLEALGAITVNKLLYLVLAVFAIFCAVVTVFSNHTDIVE